LKQNEPVDDDYEEESEDNNKNFNEDLEQIENEVKKIRHLNEQRNEYWEKLNQTLREIEKVKGEVKELLERRIIRRRTMIILPNNGSDDETDEQNMEHKSSHPYSCCGEIWYTCYTNELITYDNEDEDEVAQENEHFYSEQHAVKIILHYSYNPEEIIKQINNEKRKINNLQQHQEHFKTFYGKFLFIIILLNLNIAIDIQKITNFLINYLWRNKPLLVQQKIVLDFYNVYF
jgi:hypothetical protein